VVSEKSIFLIEIKSLDNEWRVFDRIHTAQVNRLRRNLVLLSHFKSKSPEVCLRAFVSWVNFKNQVSIVEI